MGAGASQPFNYPTGIELRELIRKGTRNCDIIEALKKLYNHFDENNCSEILTKFIGNFSESSVRSIDFFLEKNPTYMDIGKMTIASYIIPEENDEKLRDIKPRDISENWYIELFDRVKDSFDDFDKNQISFITFNYDRSLEQFLFEALKHLFLSKTEEECAEKLKKIPLIHLYGKIDPLPWEDRTNGQGYSLTTNIYLRLKNATENIKLINDERDVKKSKEFQGAHNLIKKAQKIYFLGFSFDSTNLERLDVKLMNSKSIYGTSFGLGGARKFWVENYFKKHGATIDLFNVDVFTLLKNNLAYE